MAIIRGSYEDLKICEDIGQLDFSVKIDSHIYTNSCVFRGFTTHQYGWFDCFSALARDRTRVQGVVGGTRQFVRL